MLGYIQLNPTNPNSHPHIPTKKSKKVPSLKSKTNSLKGSQSSPFQIPANFLTFLKNHVSFLSQLPTNMAQHTFPRPPIPASVPSQQQKSTPPHTSSPPPCPPSFSSTGRSPPGIGRGRVLPAHPRLDWRERGRRSS